MENLKRTLVIIVALLLVGGSAYGGFYFLKKYIKKTPEVLVNTPTTNTSAQVNIPGFAKDPSNKIPTVFPEDLIVEKNITPIESFSVKGTSETQYTYRYVTKLSADENYRHFSTFTSANDWKIQSDVKFNSGWSVSFSKQNKNLSLVHSFNVITEEAIVDITLSTKN